MEKSEVFVMTVGLRNLLKLPVTLYMEALKQLNGQMDKIVSQKDFGQTKLHVTVFINIFQIVNITTGENMTVQLTNASNCTVLLVGLRKMENNVVLSLLYSTIIKSLVSYLSHIMEKPELFVMMDLELLKLKLLVSNFMVIGKYQAFQKDSDVIIANSGSMMLPVLIPPKLLRNAHTYNGDNIIVILRLNVLNCFVLLEDLVQLKVQ